MITESVGSQIYVSKAAAHLAQAKLELCRASRRSTEPESVEKIMETITRLISVLCDKDWLGNK